MPKRSHKECYEVSKEEAKYMSSTPTTACAAITRSNKKLEHYAAALQLQQIPNETFNIEYRVVVDGSEAFDTAPSIRTNEHCDNSIKTSSAETTPTSANVIYENLLISPPLSSKHHFQDSHLNLSKNLILQKFFRSTERNYAAYENLCTGCGYGVFEARGRLCNFCQYVVHGSLKSNEQQRLDAESTNGNIYENICEKCSAIYSSDECVDCSQNALLKHESEQQLSETHFEVCEAIPHDTVVKKTKSLGKRDKKRFFHGLIGSLRRVKSNLTTSTSTISPSETPLNRSRLEIVHNVEGYDKVFRTQDTFDLEKICELKRSQTSCSEQHIYGRLKLLREPTLSQSHDQLLCGKAESLLEEQPVTASADCLNTSTQSAQPLVKKRPRISKARLLSFKTHSKIIEIKPKQKAKQSLYLVDNVCQWMTSLRYEIHYYRSFGLDDDTIGLCNPKSIPAKNTLSYSLNSKAPPRTNSVTNIDIIQKSENLEKFLKISKSAGGCDSDISSGNSSADPDDLDDDDCDAAVVTLRHHSNDNSKFKQRSPVAPQTLEQQMVQEFKQQLMAKQLQQRENMAALSGTTAATTTPTITTRNSTTNTAQHRIKRQAIYLKTDETLQNNESNEKSTNSNNNNADAKVNYSPPSTAASEFVTEHGLASRRAALQANATTETQPSSKRCGIYERDSEFVNDILSAFEQFLSRDTATVDASTEVVAKHNHFDPNKGKEVNQTLEIGTIARNTVALNAAAASDLPPRAFDDLQQQQSDRELNKQNTTLPSPCLYSENVVFVVQPNVIASPSATTDRAIEQIFNVVELISDLTLSRSLNKIVIYYDKHLSVFLLRSVHDRVLYRSKYMHWTPERLVRKYQRFVNYCGRLSSSAEDNTVTRKLQCDHKKLLLNLEIPKTKPVSESEEVTQSSDISSASDRESVGTTNCVQITVKLRSVEKSTDVKDCEIKVLEKIVERNSRELLNSKESRKSANNQIKPPQVPQRDPKTCVTPPAATTPTNETTPPLPAKRESPKMTVPSNNSNASAVTPTKLTNNNNQDDDDEEDIYQPIWKFKTVGEVQERYETDADYFELHDPSAKSSNSTGAVVPNILISTDVEDHGEWETDDEFMFTTQLTRNDADADACSLNSSTMRSTRSGSSNTGSTITNDASSITTMGSAISTSLMHHLFRNVGIFYSLTDRKLRAIIYDYDRVHASVYFAKRQTMLAATTKAPIGKSSPKLERSPIPPPRTTSAASSKTKAAATATSAQSNFPGGESHLPTSLPLATKSTAPKLQLLPDSVQAWKFMLLDVNYLEDEEDMIVSESEIIRAQESKEDPDTRQNQQLNFLQRFKSASFGNLVDIPTEEDKKSIAERMRNKLQRGVFKLNVRSPKSEKKSRGKFRRAEATSLYLEDGMKPKYPIFGAPLDNLELNQTTQPNVPRFVVDCVAYIERKDCIQQDGLYRASGNKVSIDELKQKLSESYIYDPKLLVTDDIHTLTSLLKQFFRELGAPLIPQETYERLGRNLTDPAAIETLRKAFEEMREPNRSTLQFLIKHLTNVATYSAENRMPASNLAIVWGPCILSANQIEYDIARMNTLAKVLIENYDRIFGANERLVC